MEPTVLDSRETIVIAILVLYLGKYLTRKINFLREYNIPEPVSGGVLASLLAGLIYFTLDVEFKFDLELRDHLLLVFFTTIGLSSRLKTLIQGGKPLLILLAAAVGYLVLQNLTGVAVMSVSDLGAMTGLIGGSVSLSGGHGTAIAWAPRFAADYGIGNAMEIGIACATFGLVLGGLIGGPIAKFLITRHRLQPTQPEELTIGVPHEDSEVHIEYNSMLNAILVISVAVGVGIGLHEALTAAGAKLPLFVTCLFAGILLTNTVPYLRKGIEWPTGSPSMALISDISLGLFLAMSLMSLQLWTLLDLAGPIITLLAMQVLVIFLYVTLVVFRILGKDYDAAVMSAGYAGLGLGATPTAIANMTAVTEKYGGSAKAFLVVPLVGAFFIDIANSFVIQRFIAWLQ